MLACEARSAWRRAKASNTAPEVAAGSMGGFNGEELNLVGLVGLVRLFDFGWADWFVLMLDFAGFWWTLVDLSWLAILPAVILPVWASLIFVEDYNSIVQKTGTSFHPLVYKLISILLTGLVSVGITVPFLHRFDSKSMQHGGNHMQFTRVIHTDAPDFLRNFGAILEPFPSPKRDPAMDPFPAGLGFPTCAALRPGWIWRTESRGRRHLAACHWHVAE